MRARPAALAFPTGGIAGTELSGYDRDSGSFSAIIKTADGVVRSIRLVM